MKQFMTIIQRQIKCRVDALVMILQGWEKRIVLKYRGIKNYIQILRSDWHMLRTMKVTAVQLDRISLDYEERPRMEYPRSKMRIEFYSTAEIGTAVVNGKMAVIYILVPKS